MCLTTRPSSNMTVIPSFKLNTGAQIPAIGAHARHMIYARMLSSGRPRRLGGHDR
jgi:hypothetical protein